MKPHELVAFGSLVSLVSVVATLWFSNSRSIDYEGTKLSKSANSKVKKYSEEIRDEQQARTRAFLKDEGLNNLRNTKVAVVGVGGVGSWVATMLARSGVGHITLVDFDQVSLSSLNRHACATLSDVGKSKVDCLTDYIYSFAPWVEVNAINRLWTKETGPQMLEGCHYVVDCIDNLETKVDLLTCCVQSNIEVISSMGAGTKADPTRITVGDISETIEDPLSRHVRIALRAHGINGGITVVYSTEKPGKDKAKLLELEDSQLEEGPVGELAVLKDFRVRILPVLGPLPAIFGLTIATHLLNLIGGYNSVFDPVQGGYNYAQKKRNKTYGEMQSNINGQFIRLGLTDKTTHVSLGEIEYLLEEVWRGKTLNGEYIRHKLTLWDPSKPKNIHNMIVVTRNEQQRHEQLVFKEGKPLHEVYTAEEIAHVEYRMALDRWYQQFRVN